MWTGQESDEMDRLVILGRLETYDGAENWKANEATSRVILRAEQGADGPTIAAELNIAERTVYGLLQRYYDVIRPWFAPGASDPRDRATAECQQCGESFNVTPGRKSSQRYCGQGCKRAVCIERQRARRFRQAQPA